MEERLFRLRSGDWVLVRPLCRDDSRALAAAVEQLGAQSRYRRFHSHTPHLSEQKLKSLTDIDHHDHEALVAVAPRSSEILGVARFVRDADSPSTAELAILVGDAWQRRGLGTLLLGQLARRAADVGISHFTAEILTENAPALKLVHQLGTADMTQHGPTVTAQIDTTEWLPAEDPSAGTVLRALADANAVLVPRLVQALMELSAELTRRLVIPVTPLIDQLQA